ncbi:MAG TPA: hypothetical protein VFI75_03120 [Candidatus Acidoferrum sp.]|nr:hypothetical protein [Candidatus Acidoferrum sp.]
MIEINLNFVLFEELQENPEHHALVTRIVVIRQSKNSAAALDDNAADQPLE